MGTPVAERAVLDTNILLAATDEGRGEHGAAVDALSRWPAAGMVLYTSGQILREYLVVATRPVDVGGLGMAATDAVLNVHALRTRLNLLVETAKVADRLLDLLGEVQRAGRQVHDANVVATMLVHGVDTVVTLNRRDFARFERHVHVAALPAIPQ